MNLKMAFGNSHKKTFPRHSAISAVKFFGSLEAGASLDSQPYVFIFLTTECAKIAEESPVAMSNCCLD